MSPKPSLLLLRPAGNKPSALEQFHGAELAARSPALRGCIVLHEDMFVAGNLTDLEKKVQSLAGKISGVVAATDVPASTHLGEVADNMGILCFVANNNPAVWQHRRHVFHIGVPTNQTSKAVAECLYHHVGARRVLIIYDDREFQRRVATAAISALTAIGGEVTTIPGNHKDWLNKVATFHADLVYLAYSEDARALPYVRGLRRKLPLLPILVGRSLLHKDFVSTLGKNSENLLAVDMFDRSGGGSKKANFFLATLARAGVAVPTANHGFGWDGMLLCGTTLVKTAGDVTRAIAALESGELYCGATGRFAFSSLDHNGRSQDNPTLLSKFNCGRWEIIGKPSNAG